MRQLTIRLLALAALLLCLNARSVEAAVATYAGTDTSTQGNWSRSYGTVGYYIPNGPSQTPSDGSSVNPGSASLWTWGTNVASKGALQTGGSSNIASCWFDNSTAVGATLVLDVKVPPGDYQTVAVYLQDYSQQGRAELVSLTDPLGGNAEIIPSIEVSGANFVNGEYLVFTISGEVHFNFTLVSGPNPVANGIFFGQSATTPPPIKPGAYITRIPGATGLPLKLSLTLPVGTYLVDAVASVAVIGSFPSGVGCSIDDPSIPVSLDGQIAISGATVIPVLQQDGGSTEGATNLAMHEIYTKTITGPINLNCWITNSNDGGQNAGSIVMTAIPLTSVVTQ